MSLRIEDGRVYENDVLTHVFIKSSGAIRAFQHIPDKEKNKSRDNDMSEEIEAASDRAASIHKAAKEKAEANAKARAEAEKKRNAEVVVHTTSGNKEGGK